MAVLSFGFGFGFAPPNPIKGGGVPAPGYVFLRGKLADGSYVTLTGKQPIGSYVKLQGKTA